MKEPTASGRHDLQMIARRAMLERGFLPDFDAPALAELEAIKGPVAVADSSIHEMQGLLWASIDNDDSLDLDQLSVAEPLAGGQVRVLVAIADVDALVRKAAPIDAHAQRNTRSVYTAAHIFPMLPERLSTDLTSLVEGQERLAIVIEMVASSDGVVVGSDVYRARVRNHARLAYNGVAAWLAGGPMPPQVKDVPGLVEQLHLQDGVARAMRSRRLHHGALSLRTIESKVVFDGDVIADLRPVEQNRAESLIEDLMVAANGVTARYLEGKGVPAFRRVLRVPERWDRIVVLAGRYGGHLPAAPDAAALEAFLVKQQEAHPMRFPDLSLSIVKLMGPGEYVVDIPGEPAEGHFGLAVTAYTHSTAPNRRFPDLVTQRLLKAAIVGDSAPYGADELGVLARHCTEQEDNAKKVERQVQKSAAALLLEPRIGERFEGIVTGASGKGTWVRIVHPSVEGKVVRGFEGLDVGDHVDVKLVGTDVERGFIDFERVAGPRQQGWDHA
jgi:exoribonuclease-2